MKRVPLLILIAAALGSCSSRHRTSSLQSELENYISEKNCRIGVAVICGDDTVAVNGDEYFPMQSVFKFPQAVAVADFCDKNGIAPEDSVSIDSSMILRDTYSPLREHYGVVSLRIPIGELLEYSLVQSDNNACDILFDIIGSTAVADSVIKSMGFSDIDILHTEADMHLDTALCHKNRTTPVEMARFTEYFRNNLADSTPFMRAVRQNLELCATGMSRIPGADFEDGTLIAHKTGTGDVSPAGCISAVNDAGYIELPEGKSYSIAVFVADSPAGMEATEAIIGDISEIVRRHISK